MQLTTVKELFKERDKYLNQEIQVGGWIRSIRDSKAFGFIVLNVQSGISIAYFLWGFKVKWA